MASPPSRPRVICHMMTSLDGRIVTTGWPLTPEGRRQYELVHAGYEPDGWMCGRVTMEPFAKRLRSDAEVARAFGERHSRGLSRARRVRLVRLRSRRERTPGVGVQRHRRRPRRRDSLGACFR